MILPPLPTLPLRDIVVLPKMIVPLFVGRKKSVSALNVLLNQYGSKAGDPRASQATTPRTTDPQSTTSRVVISQPANPRVVVSQPAGSPSTNPSATSPQATNPPAASSQATGSPSTDPKATGSQAANPQAANPSATNPQAANPKDPRASIQPSKRELILLTQRKASTDDPAPKDLYSVGVSARVLQQLRLPDGTVKVLVEAAERVRVQSFTKRVEYLESICEEATPPATSKDSEGIMRALVSKFEEFTKLGNKIPPDTLTTITQMTSADKIADVLAGHLPLKIAEKQEILETFDPIKRLEILYARFDREIELVKMERKIRSRVRSQMDKTQREYYLNEQMKAIQVELGEGTSGKGEFARMEEKIKKIRLSKEAKEKVTSELRKLKQMSSSSAEANVVRNFIDWILSIPWNKRTKNLKDLKKAETILNDRHYGLKKVKERILEYMAVQTRTKKSGSTILCLVGPPGVGKTSLGKAMAEATGRNFVRVSLGGVRDESEIRGHRRTYIGSMPGKIIQGMKKAKSSNPLFLLDEVDKLGLDWRGDPASALLEVLDPEQNVAFNDHYLEVDYDLSDVMFVTTANTLKMAPPLLDRMEIIRIAGYTEDEKVNIATLHLIPRQMKRHGIKKGEITISEESLRHLIRYYTKEAGVRNLEREIASICRKVVRKLVSKEVKSMDITPQNLGKLAGVRRHKYGEVGEKNEIGVSTGLAWTEFGGELLSVEAVVMAGKGRASHTGKLGDVMKESVQAAVSFLRSRGESLGIPKETFEKSDIHVHVPDGATPKDGPSAGIAICTAVLSALCHIPTLKEVAMTGEITLSGRVLPIGGLREKLLAALRGGVSTVIIPEDNRKDLEEIPEKVKKGLEIIPVKSVEEIWHLAMARLPLPKLKEEGKDVPLPAGSPKPVVKH